MIEDTIARLTGRLTFEVSSAPLTKFLSMLKAAEASMTRVGKSAEQMQAKLNKAFNVSSKSALAERAKLDSAVLKSQNKELSTLQKIARLQHAQNTAAISAQKLVATGHKEEAFLQSASLKQQVAQAVLAAKQQKVQQELLKTKLGESKIQAASEQSKIREARYADILLKRQAATVKLQQLAALHQTKYQRAQAALVNARASGVRQAERFRDSKALAAAREARAQVRQEQQKSRFDFAAERHAAWQAKQAEPQGIGFAGLTVGLGAAGAALYSLTAGLSYLNERITKRQEVTADNQQFDNTLLAAGNNDKERTRIKEAYITNSQEFGMKIDRESAVAYSNMIQGFRAQGKTLEQAIQLQKDQAAVFRIGNLDKTQQYSAALQLNQGYSKDRFMGQDLRPLTDALGTRLTTILYKAIGKALGYKGDQKKLAGFVLEAQHDGKVNGAMVQQGLRDIVAQSPELLERHKRSLDAQAVRLENDTYLQGVSVNEDPELIAVLGERLTAERELTEALKPLKESLMEFDKGLTTFNTSLIRWMIGHDSSGNATPNAMSKDPNPEPGSVGAALGPRLKPAPLNEQGSLDNRAKPGMWNDLRRLLTGSSIEDDQSVADENRERWGKVQVWTQNLLGMQYNKINTSKFNAQPPDETGQLKPFRPYQPYTSDDIMEGAAQQQKLKAPAPESWLLPGDLNGATVNKPVENIDQSHTEIRVDVKIDARGMSAEEVEKISAESTQRAWDQALQTVRANQKEVE